MSADRVILIATLLCAFAASALPATKEERIQIMRDNAAKTDSCAIECAASCGRKFK